MKLVRIVAPHFVAAVVADSVVRECAPILSYMTGWNGRQVATTAKRKVSWGASRTIYVSAMPDGTSK